MLDNKKLDSTLLSEKEVAKALRVSREALRVRRLRGNPPRFYKIGKRVLYDEQDVVAFLGSCLKESTEQKGENK